VRTFKGLQWYAQRTLLGYRTFMATLFFKGGGEAGLLTQTVLLQGGDKANG